MESNESNSWKARYREAILEADTNKLLERIDLADAAIRARLAHLQPDADHHHERQAINNALKMLDTLRRLNGGSQK